MKVSQFNVYAPSLFEGTTLLYNTLTGSFLSLDDAQLEQAIQVMERVEDGEELRSGALVGELAQGGFIVSDALDERAVVRERYWKKDAAKNPALSLTIAPTVNCNFGCTYCFQEHPNRKMSRENIDAIKVHVAKKLETASGLYVTWFGGEPLLAFATIKELNTFFHEACERAGVPFKQSMITNGSLLHGERLAYFRGQSNVSYIQITLDGPPQAHDRRRLQVSGKPTFRTILDNIKAAAGSLRISLRINVDKTNAGLLGEFLDILAAEGLRDKVSPYLGHVLPYTHVCEDVDDVAYSKEEFASVESDFQLALLERGFRPNASLPTPRFGNICVADHPNGAVFAPDNLVFQCWNEVTEPAQKASGSLDADGIASTQEQAPVRERWETYDPFSHEQCKDCLVQPLCKGGCPWEARKNPQWSTGHCTTLKFNLPDRLRLYHLMRTIDAHPGEDVRLEPMATC